MCDLWCRERGIYGGADLRQTPEYASAPEMEYVTPEGARFSGGEAEIPQNNIVFSKGGTNQEINIKELTRNEEFLPTQTNINIERVQYYIELLEKGEALAPIEVINVPGKGKFIVEGHHRYIASLQTGIPVRYYMIEAKGPIGESDWTNVEWKDYQNEDQFWND